MKSSFTKQPGSIIDLKVELTLEEFKEYYQPVFDEALLWVQIKGFRPGQAPREMAKNYVDQDKVFEKAANSAIRYSLNGIIEENQWMVIDKPLITIESTNAIEVGLRYVAKLTAFPDIQLGDYKKIARQSIEESAESLEKIEVTDKEIDDSLEWLKKSRGVSELNDNFAQSLGHHFKNLADLRQSTREGIFTEKKIREKEKTRLKILEKLIEQSKIDIPQIMIDKTKEHLAKEWKGADKEALNDTVRKRVMMQLVIYRIAQLENLQPSDDEVKEEIARHPDNKKLDTARFYDYIYDVLQNKKVFEFLSSFAPQREASEDKEKQ